MYVCAICQCTYLSVPSSLLCLIDSLFTQPVGQSCVKMWMKQRRSIVAERRSIVAERSVVAESVAPKCYTHCETGISSVSGKKHVMVQLSTTTGCATTC